MEKREIKVNGKVKKEAIVWFKDWINIKIKWPKVEREKDETESQGQASAASPDL